MDVTQLQSFKLIAETQSLTKAAGILHVSQPAMSTMLKKFEEELDAELFDRSPNRIHLNKTGEIALIHVNNILRAIEQMKADIRSTAQKDLTLSAAFCDPGVRWFCVPRFSVACPDVHLKDDLYEGSDAAKLLKDRVYDLIITSYKIKENHISSVPFLKDQVLLSVPDDSSLLGYDAISLKDIPAQPLLYPQIGGYFLSQIEKLITENDLQITMVKNNFNIYQHLIRTTNFLATISRLSIDLRNDGTHRALIPFSDPELSVTFYISYLASNREKIMQFLNWAKDLN
ncbi:MAG TPA: LysR family transcriptional regulator [Candidatus Mediterraneibacter vanvlietii]|nr:LysR family transcriptional regulator [Candidatus Mediterraneibacter vanvlietii]